MRTTDYAGLWRRTQNEEIEFRYPEWIAWTPLWQFHNRFQTIKGAVRSHLYGNWNKEAKLNQKDRNRAVVVLDLLGEGATEEDIDAWLASGQPQRLPCGCLGACDPYAHDTAADWDGRSLLLLGDFCGGPRLPRLP